MNIQWFPGHMAKTKRLLTENLKLVDVVIELLDARIPASSKNPEIDKIIKNKPRLVVLNKSDLADNGISRRWSDWYRGMGIPVLFADSVKGTGLNKLISNLRHLMKDRFERDRQKGRRFRTIKTMVVGIPNVGKSTFINKIAGRAVAATGDRPGVTKGKQWIRLHPEIDLLDTPGILWPKFDDRDTALNLAFTGAIKDEILDVIQLAAALAEKLSADYPELFFKRYKLQNAEGLSGIELLEAAGKNRGCILSGGIIDMKRIADTILDEFRGGKIGAISLEKPTWDETGDTDGESENDSTDGGAGNSEGKTEA
ncbi:MAG: ribosome biogenesis GTPase YlqF [Clostridiaceae bacterium]|jgi:ribosome biogenesis GTPase A|nr:ribosome biogenesis GTPase YlqF [Clostridiaceae bacterium]